MTPGIREQMVPRFTEVQALAAMLTMSHGGKISLSADEAARALDISLNTFKGYVNSRKIQPTQKGGRVTYSVLEVARFSLESHHLESA